MATLPDTYPASQSTAGGWTSEAGGTTNLHLLVDETSPGTDYIRSVLNAACAAFKFGIGSRPADFDSMTTLTFNARISRGGVEAGDNGGGNDTYTVRFQVFQADGTTPLTDLMTITTGTVGFLVADFNVAATGVVASTKAVWDGALLAADVAFTKVGTNDGDRIWIDRAWLTGTYAVVSNDKSGSAATSQAHSIVNVGTKATSGVAATSQASTITNPGAKGASGLIASSAASSLSASGFKQAFGVIVTEQAVVLVFVGEQGGGAPPSSPQMIGLLLLIR